MSSPFTLTIDWLAFTIRTATVRDTMRVIGGDWTKAETGFRGYPVSWILAGAGRGSGKLGTRAMRDPLEVHVDLSAGIVASWSQDKVRAVLQWVLEKGGHLTRIDCALDDRASSVSLPTVKDAITTGKCVTRADRMQCLSSGSIHTGTPLGETIYIGSPQSQTLLRIYDKRLEMQTHDRVDWQEYGIRWELQLKKTRAHACGELLARLEEASWLEVVVGALRTYVDFRDVDPVAPDAYRCRAPLLAWWEHLTDGFHKARFVVEKDPQTIERVKRWVSKSLAPMLAVVCVAEPDGQAWLNRQMDAGVNRWKDRHRRLLRKPAGKGNTVGAGVPETSGASPIEPLPPAPN